MSRYSGHQIGSVAAILLALAIAIELPQAVAQKNIDEAERRADVDLSGSVDQQVPVKPNPAETGDPAKSADAAQPAAAPQVVVIKRLQVPDIDVLTLASPEVSGVFMYPIYVFAFLVLLFVVERGLALRRARVVPPLFVQELKVLGTSQQGFDLRQAYGLCKQFPSAAASVVRAELLKMGRPQAEVEAAIARANKKEAARLRLKLRPLKLAASATPLLGLLGTVQGIIYAFYATAHMPDSSDKAQTLAASVCTAFVATFAGLVVGITAVCFAHLFEGKVQRLVGEIDDLACNLLPELQGYEGKVRVSRQVLNGTTEGPEKSFVTNRLPE
jgi:biopolymer transport protein ExbB